MKRNFLQFIFLIVIGVAGCNPVFENPSLSEAEETSANLEEESAVEQETGMRMRMGPGSGMMARHHAPIPAEYAGISNPVAADQNSLQQGAELYGTYCVSCHGDGGMGDGS